MLAATSGKTLLPSAALEALRSRKTFASANAKVAMHVTLDDAVMGDSATLSAPVRVQAHLACAKQVATAGLVLLVEPFVSWYYQWAWWSYILAADALNRRLGLLL